MTGPHPTPMMAAGQILAERGLYGLVWFGADLVVQARYGGLMKRVEIGLPITDTIYALIGLEDRIADLRREGAPMLDIPAVSMVTEDGPQPRINLTVYWSADESCFVLLASRATASSEVEQDLIRQMRARLIAEAEVSAKSRELEKANAELARANADLESFASIISHDLKSPMRALRYMVDDLEAELGPHAGASAQRTIAHLRTQSRRMSGMLSALLDYSTIGLKSEAIEPVDSRQMINAIVASLRVPAGMEVELCGAWPCFATLAAPLDLVLRNLVDNAIKHHDRAQGRIRLEAHDQEQHVVFQVEDDGPGIRPEHQQAAFLPFRKLDAERASDGHGMGLALVKRTVEGIGGTLSLVSGAPAERGTVFIIAWPKSGQFGD